jgi:ABC-type transporter Mla maintaining outer membrane lipid asymmetry ATPase subunit MlaF
MKITRKQLKQIIKEEATALEEISLDSLDMSEIEKIFKDVEIVWDKYFDYDGTPKEAAQFDEQTMRQLKRRQREIDIHYSTPLGKAALLDFILSRQKGLSGSDKEADALDEGTTSEHMPDAWQQILGGCLEE